MGAKFTTAQASAQKEYRKKIEVVQITLPPGEKEKIRTAADTLKMSVNGYIKAAITEKMEREKPE